MMMKKAKRLNLRGFAEMEAIKKHLSECLEKKDMEKASNLIVQIVELGGLKCKPNEAWFDTVSRFTEVQAVNLPTIQAPILTVKSRKKEEDAPWDYIGREWYWWYNLFSSHYGWTEKQIEILDIDDAIALYQEIMVDEQMKMEFEYGLSEMAYEYVPSTKKSRFRPMPRPDWMVPQYKPKPIKMTKIPASMMPVGNVINLDEG